jgi:ERCC4-related helicase
MQLRTYQAEIVDAIELKGNTLVVLPTGAGKTLIAAEYFRRVIEAHRLAGTVARCLFLVPKRILVEQQAIAIEQWIPTAVVKQYMGGLAPPGAFDVLVATPDALRKAQQLRKVPQLPELHAIAFDEVHHVLKEDPYAHIAKDIELLRMGGCTTLPVFVGLSASLSYAVEQRAADCTIEKLARLLNIRHMETRRLEQLHFDDFDRETLVADVDLPNAVVEGVVPDAQRKPHLMPAMFLGRIAKRTATPAALAIHAVVSAMEKNVQRHDTSYESALTRPNIASWGELAHKLAGKKGTGDTLRRMFIELEDWYETLRILVTSWEELPDAAYVFLEMNAARRNGGLWAADVDAAVVAALAAKPVSFPRFDHLRNALLRQHHDTFRGLLFVQQKLTAHILRYYVESSPELQHLFRCGCFHSASAATPSLRMTTSEGKQAVSKFSEGTSNLLIATVAAEEGLDVRAANCVLRFDPVLTPVSLAQGRGRARERDSKFVVLAERPDRTTADLVAAEQLQTSAIERFTPADPAVLDSQARAAQTAREHQCRALLVAVDDAKARQQLNAYCQKTKVALVTAVSGTAGAFRCTVTYRSPLRAVDGSAVAGDKKAAKVAAAQDLFRALRAASL